MVHALEEIRRLVKADGCLIDIHPIPNAALFKIHRGSELLLAEPDPGYDTDESIPRAEEALAEAVQRGLFLIERKDEFELVTYASTLAELRDYWAAYGAYDDTPKDEAVTAQEDAVYAKADEIMQNAPGAEITYHERARITRMEPVGEE